MTAIAPDVDHAQDGPAFDSANAPPDAVLVPLNDLPPRGCRWFFNGTPMLACGAPTATGSPYCDHHKAMVHRPTGQTVARSLRLPSGKELSRLAQ